MILCFLEHDGGKFNAWSYEALTFARQLAQEKHESLHAVAIGDALVQMSEAVSAFGVSTLHVAHDERLNEYSPTAYAASIVTLSAELKPFAVLAAASERGNEIMAHVAARMSLPMATNCVGFNAGEPFVVTRLRWGGSLLEEAKLYGTTKLLTVAPNAIEAERAASIQPIYTHIFTPNLSENDLRVRVTSRAEAANGEVSLSEARVVVGGGRGVGSAEGFRALEELAALLGGAVGASRAVTSLGWRAHSDQIGQTGTRIAPELYIACGVSGAIQHLIGCKAAKHILAINTDPDAPIMQKANYALIGDLHQVLPAVSAALRQIKK